MELSLSDWLELLERAHQLYEGPVEPLHLIRQVWRVQLFPWLQLLAPLLRERLDWEDVDYVLQDCLESDSDELGACCAVVLQQRQEQLELLEPELEDWVHPDLQCLSRVELFPPPFLRCVRLQLLFRWELLELLPWPLLRQKKELDELARGPREYDPCEEPVLVCWKEQEEDDLLPELE